MNSVLFIRHGVTAGNLRGRYIGCTDEPLCAEGAAQIVRLRPSMPETGFLFVSPMLRTRQTAAILFPDIPPTLSDGLREMNFGVFEGKTPDELSNEPRYTEWVNGLCLSPVPEGDSVSRFKARCTNTFLSLMRSVPDGESAVFVTHGGVIMSVMEALALPERSFYDYHLACAGVLRCRYDRKAERIFPEADT